VFPLKLNQILKNSSIQRLISIEKNEFFNCIANYTASNESTLFLLEPMIDLLISENGGQEEIESLDCIIKRHVVRTHHWTPLFQHFSGGIEVKVIASKANEIHKRYAFNVTLCR
jgi:hypothetical protein